MTTEAYLLPTSFSQQRLWVVERLTPGGTVYSMPWALELRGPLNLSALRHSIAGLSQRHETLRTTFAEMEGSPLQVVAEERQAPVRRVDLTGLTPTRRDSSSRGLLRSEADRPFDLERGPLLRVLMVRVESAHHFLLINLHHIVGDGWSLGVLWRELGTQYDAFVHGRPSGLAPLRIQYGDFAEAQRRWLRGEVLAEQLEYWKRTLAGAPTLLELPSDRPRPPVQSFAGARCSRYLASGVVRRLQDLSQHERMTLFMVLLAAFGALLYRYTRQRDMLVGTPVANRNQVETEGLIGFFVNTLPIRMRLVGALRFGTLLQQVRDTALDAFAHPELPFEKLVEELAPERRLSYNPILQVVFSVETDPLDPRDLEGLHVDEIDLESSTSKYDLGLSVKRSDDGLEVVAQYSTALFDCSRIERFLTHYTVLLGAVVERPEQRLADLPLLTEREKDQLRRWARGRVGESRRDPTVLESVANQARIRGDAVAVAQGQRFLTYGELDRRARILAAGLQRFGVGPETRVGVCRERCLDQVVSWLAVWRAGGAYVSLDPSLPVERLRFMLEDSRARFVLTREPLAEALEGTAHGLECLDSAALLQAGVEERESLPESPCGLSPQQLAYVIYTSGSTGRPKGVAIHHDGLLRLVHWHQRAFQVGPRDRATQVAGLGFDASVWETWPYLSAGAGLRLLDEEAKGSLERLRDWLVAHQVTITFQPTPLAEKLLQVEWPQGGTLRWLLTGGDRLRRHPPQGLPFKVSNNYGPTESTVVTTSVTLTPGSQGVPTIGRAIDGTRVWVLDRWLQPVPVGVPGELYVGGEGLARGYLGKAAQTAAWFLPDPRASEAGDRLYRTGDLVRFREDGQLEFLGRVDQQVSIHGQRIELGEIEAVLAAQSQVIQCAVVVEERQGEPRLVAYVVGEAAPDTVIDALRRELPEYMVPKAYVTLPELPLNASGKVNRTALSALGQRDVDSLPEIQPQEPLDQILAHIWEDVLGVRSVGLRDDYFELGGHSLSATQMLSRVRRALNVEVPLRALFEAPVLEDFSARVSALMSAGSESLPAIRPVRREGKAPLSFAQQRLWFLEQMFPGSTAYNLHAALRLTGSLLPEALAQSMAEIERRHQVLRSVVIVPDGNPMQRVLPAVRRKLRRIDLRGLAPRAREAEIERLAREHAGEVIDLGTGPLFRVRLVESSTNEWILLVNMHHIVSDGWSMGVLFRDLERVYGAFSNGGRSPLDPLPVQYTDVAAWERECLQGDEIEPHLEYWRQQLGGRLHSQQLELDHQRPAIPTYRGKSEVRLLTSELLQALHALSRKEGVTLFMTLLAAFKVLLYRRNGTRDVVVGTDMANRIHGETEDLIGLFVNQLVLRTEVSGDRTFRDLLGRVRSITLEAHAHQVVPFDRLVEELRPARDPGSNPLFQIMFILQSAPVSPLRLPDVESKALSFPVETSAFDLTLSFAETETGRLRMACRYKADLFETTTIQRLMTQLTALLESATAAPNRCIAELEILTATEMRQRDMPGQQRKASKLDKLLRAKPKAVDSSVDTLLATELLVPGQNLPLAVRPQIEGVDLIQLAGEQREWIEERLQRHGAILFRGFDIDSTERLKAFTDALTSGTMGYGERSSPRTQLQEGVFTSTDHPADQPIVLHNEQSYTLNWPMKILFACVVPAKVGGNTPLADSRKILGRLREETVASFREKDVMYMRNYEEGLGLPWQEAFQTDDPKKVEDYCRGAKIELEWKPDGSLRTRQRRPAIRRHPKTGELVWFNHAFFFNVRSLEPSLRESLFAGGVSEEDLPFQTFYGDGTSIPQEVLEEIHAAFDAETVSFPWKTGDLVLVDNMLAAHGRDPYEGPRKIVVSMAEPSEAILEAQVEERMVDAR